MVVAFLNDLRDWRDRRLATSDLFSRLSSLPYAARFIGGYGPWLDLPLLAAFLGLTAVLTLLNGAAVQASSHIIYVNTAVVGGANDGSSWANAFADLQDALSVADDGDEIWVATAIYTPGAIVGDSFTSGRPAGKQG